MFQRFVLAAIASFLALSSASYCAALDEVEYKALIEKDKLKVGEKVQFMVIVNYGKGTMAPAITAPSFVQFNVLDEFQTTKEQGEGTEKYLTLKKIWLLQTTEPGRLPIASVIITYQDPSSNLLQNGKTNVVFVDVSPADDQPVQTATSVAQLSTTTLTSTGKKLALPGWLIIAGGMMVLLLVGWGIFSGKKLGSKAATLEDQAINQLEAALGHVEQGNLETYYATLSRTLLDYLQAKFDLNAHVLATAALLERLQTVGIRKDIIPGLEHFFSVADKAKFAGYVPDEDEMIVMHGTVKSFIEAGRNIKVKPAKPKKKASEDED